MVHTVHHLTVCFFTRKFSGLLRLPKLKKLQVRFWQGMAASMVACYSMVAAVLVKKPVMVGKVASGACSFEAALRFSRVQISRS